MSHGRLIATFATALVVVAGVGYAASQTVLARSPLVVAQQPQYVEAPSPDTQLVEQPDAPSAPTKVDPAWVSSVSYM